MTVLVVKPGQVGASRLLADVLRDRHEQVRAAHKRERDYRAAHGLPMDERMDWPAELAALDRLRAAVDAQDGAAARAEHMAGLARLSVLPLDTGDYTPPEGLEDVAIRPRHLSAAEVQALREAHADALQAGDAAAVAAVESAWVARAIAEVSGLACLDDAGAERALRIWSEGPDGRLGADELAMLAEAGLLPWLVVVSAWLAQLPPGKALRSGVRPPTT